MRCLSCNVILSSREASRKSIHTGQYLDLCRGCCKDAEIYEYTENNTVPIDDAPEPEDFIAGDDDVSGDDIYNISDFDLLTTVNEEDFNNAD